KSFASASAMKPARAAALASAGIASSRLPSTTSTCAIRSGTFARSFSICGGTKWIIRSSFTGSSRSGAGAPMASGWKKFRGSFTSWSWSMPSDLLQRDVGLLDDLAPELRFLGKKFRRLGAGFGDRLHLNAVDLFDHVRTAENLDHVAVDPLGQRRRRLRRRHHGVPGDGAVSGQARLRDGRDLRKIAHAFAAAHGDDLDLAVAVQRERGGRRVEHEIDMAGDDVVDGLAQSAIGNLHGRDVGEHFQLNRREMPDRADARRR